MEAVFAALTYPVPYRIKGYQNNVIKGGFYEQELFKVKYPDLYLIEKVIKRRKNQVYVNYLGFANRHNDWIDKKMI